MPSIASTAHGAASAAFTGATRGGGSGRRRGTAHSWCRHAGARGWRRGSRTRGTGGSRQAPADAVETEIPGGPGGGADGLEVVQAPVRFHLETMHGPGVPGDEQGDGGGRPV